MDRARHVAKELSPSPSPNDKSCFESALSHARIVTHADIPGTRRSTRTASPRRAYSNLYRRELKDYVINAELWSWI